MVYRCFKLSKENLYATQSKLTGVIGRSWSLLPIEVVEASLINSSGPPVSGLFFIFNELRLLIVGAGEDPPIFAVSLLNTAGIGDTGLVGLGLGKLLNGFG